MNVTSYCVNFDSKSLLQQRYDYVIIGGGIAGLYAAHLAKQHGSTALINKGDFDSSDAYRAQGGIACVWNDNDSFASHIADTLTAGDGLCNEENVTIMINEAPTHIRRLIDLGVSFDTDENGYALGMEGAHSHRRILHAGDYTGKAIVTNIANAIEGVALYSQYLALDLLVDDNKCYGVLIMNIQSEQRFILWAKAIILAGGGAGNLFINTTNSPLITGDAIAMAYRKGCTLTDMEFMQFHPTALYEQNGQRFLISEAVRGEGGILRDICGERFMERYHPLKELAPRDIVARAIYAEMKKHDTPYVYLDVTSIDKAYFAARFPTIYAKCTEIGIDISKDYIPVSPAAHFLMGGIKTDSFGQTDVERLYACGECACTGVHGANRLASNSLLEGLVFAARAVKHASSLNTMPEHRRFKWWHQRLPETFLTPDEIAAIGRQLQAIMERYVGIERDGTGLNQAIRWLEQYEWILGLSADRPDIYELQSLIIVGYAMARAALFRCESRGSHYRTDYPAKNDMLKHHIIIKGENIAYDTDYRQIHS
ncbi:L-aspartate oxidase [Mahella australiensis]|uniref:L-aspartate oxidase n=1 Tax=Mahella australiensis (strain DSM 15567 / CIP 107919 / 50-1 BON) TaxID=697281 RepID=F3ZVH7_MAHA5|nr:L-aspartate oxidase [Mahella australiensis]AEE96339.1 L-aspartate oxidase [Mahella australiensis 50-1 BON]